MTPLASLLKFKPKNKSAAIGGSKRAVGKRTASQRERGTPSVKGEGNFARGSQRKAVPQPAKREPCGDGFYWDEDTQSCVPIEKKKVETKMAVKSRITRWDDPVAQEGEWEEEKGGLTPEQASEAIRQYNKRKKIVK